MPAADDKLPADGDAGGRRRKPSSIYRWLVVKLVRRRLLHPISTPQPHYHINSDVDEENSPNVVISVLSPDLHSPKSTIRSVDENNVFDRCFLTAEIPDASIHREQHHHSRPRPRSRSLRLFERSPSSRTSTSAYRLNTATRSRNAQTETLNNTLSLISKRHSSTSTDPEYCETSYDAFSESLNSAFPSSISHPPVELYPAARQGSDTDGSLSSLHRSHPPVELYPAARQGSDTDGSLSSLHRSQSNPSFQTDPDQTMHKNVDQNQDNSLYFKQSSEDISSIVNYSLRTSIAYDEHDRESFSSNNESCLCSKKDDLILRSDYLCFPFYSSTPIITSKRFLPTIPNKSSFPDSLPNLRQDLHANTSPTKFRPVLSFSTIPNSPTVAVENNTVHRRSSDARPFLKTLCSDNALFQRPQNNIYSSVPLKTPVSRLLERENVHKPVSVRSLETPTGDDCVDLPQVRKWDSIGVLYGSEFLIIKQKVHQRLLCILKERRNKKHLRHKFNNESSDDRKRCNKIYHSADGCFPPPNRTKANIKKADNFDDTGVTLTQSSTQDSFLSKSVSYQQVTEWRSCSTFDGTQQYASLPHHSTSIATSTRNRNIKENNKNNNNNNNNKHVTNSFDRATCSVKKSPLSPHPSKYNRYHSRRHPQDPDPNSDPETPSFSCCPCFLQLINSARKG